MIGRSAIEARRAIGHRGSAGERWRACGDLVLTRCRGRGRDLTGTGSPPSMHAAILCCAFEDPTSIVSRAAVIVRPDQRACECRPSTIEAWRSPPPRRQAKRPVPRPAPHAGQEVRAPSAPAAALRRRRPVAAHRSLRLTLSPSIPSSFLHSLRVSRCPALPPYPSLCLAPLSLSSSLSLSPCHSPSSPVLPAAAHFSRSFRASSALLSRLARPLLLRQTRSRTSSLQSRLFLRLSYPAHITFLLPFPRFRSLSPSPCLASSRSSPGRRAAARTREKREIISRNSWSSDPVPLSIVARWSRGYAGRDAVKAKRRGPVKSVRYLTISREIREISHEFHEFHGPVRFGVAVVSRDAPSGRSRTTRCCLLSAGCLLLPATCWLLAACCWLLADGCWLPFAAAAAGCC